MKYCFKDEWLNVLETDFSFEFTNEYNGSDMFEDVGPNKTGIFSYMQSEVSCSFLIHFELDFFILLITLISLLNQRISTYSWEYLCCLRVGINSLIFRILGWRLPEPWWYQVHRLARKRKAHLVKSVQFGNPFNSRSRSSIYLF